MQTITLTDQAYERIAALRTSPTDSFSNIILRTVPKRGSGAQMLNDVRQLPPLTAAQAKTMRAAVADQRNARRSRDHQTRS